MRKPLVLILLTLVASLATLPSEARFKEFMKVNDILRQGDSLGSRNEAFYLSLSPFGNLAVKRGADSAEDFGTVWEAKANGPRERYFAILQSDGNFAVYKGAGPEKNLGYHWGTHRTASGDSFHLALSDSGRLTVAHGPDPQHARDVLWETDTNIKEITWLPYGRFLFNKTHGVSLLVGKGTDGAPLAVGKETTYDTWKFVFRFPLFRASNKRQCVGWDFDDASSAWRAPGKVYGPLKLKPCADPTVRPMMYDPSDHSIRVEGETRAGCVVVTQRPFKDGGPRLIPAYVKLLDPSEPCPKEGLSWSTQ